MANEYLKPQIPLKDLNSENYFYPLTTLDQIIIGNSRLSAYFSENDGKLKINNLENIIGEGLISNRSLFFNTNQILTSSENIFINNDSLAINTTSITSGYNFEVNGNSLFNGLISASSFFGALAEEQFNKTDIRTWCDTATNIHKSSYQGDMVLKRFFSQDEAATIYNLPCTDSHMMIFSIDGEFTNWTRILALDMRSPTLFIGGKNSDTWQPWTQLITDNTAQTITNEKTFTTDIAFNTNTDLGIIQSYYNGTKYNILRHHNNGNISLNAESGDLYLGYTNTGIVHTTKTLKIDGGMNWPAPQNIICSYTANNQECSFDLTPGSYTGCYWHVWSTKSSASILQCFVDNRHVAIPVHLYVGGYNNTSYGLSTNSFICNSWVRTVGATGWYNESYGGGWYMADTTWIRNYGSKQVYLNNNLRIDANLNVGTNSTGGNIWCGTYKDTAHGEHQVGVASGAGRLYLYSHAAANGGRGLYGANNAGTNASYLAIAQDNHIRTGVRIYGAVWNDYAEFRKGQMDNLKPGQIVAEVGNGNMKLANQKLQKGCKILSDTYGFALGETTEYKLPIAVSGRVLVYCDTPNEELEPGDCLCANYTGNAIKMTQEEIIKYPDRIIGTVSEFPDYEVWHAGDQTDPNGMKEEIKVNGRIWVYVR